MNKKDRKAISNVIAGLFLLTGLYLYWMVFRSNNIYILFGLIIATPLLEGIIYSLIPGKQ